MDTWAGPIGVRINWVPLYFVSVGDAPASVRNNAGPDLDFEPMPQTTKPPRSVAGLESSRSQNSKTEERRRKLTEKSWT